MVQVGASHVWVVGVVDFVRGQFLHGKYTMMSHHESSDVHQETKLQKTGVHLDLEEGQLSFYDATTKTCLSSIRHRWTNRMFPILHTGSDLPPTALPEKLDAEDG